MDEFLMKVKSLVKTTKETADGDSEIYSMNLVPEDEESKESITIKSESPFKGYKSSDPVKVVLEKQQQTIDESLEKNKKKKKT